MSEIQRASSAITGDLLLTKLAPPRLPADRVSRASLLDRLDEGRAGKLTLISAPAGFGKSTLVAEWIQSLGTRNQGITKHLIPDSLIPDSLIPAAAWLSLDAGDNDPIRFWRYVITACRAFDAGLGKPALVALRTAQQPSWEALLTTLINQLAKLSTPGVLVLEDYHLITAPQVHETLTFLLDHLPATLHLVLITRSQPPLPLARWRTRNELRELGPADLRFSPEETQAFLQHALHISLSPEAVARLEEQTEGWAAGLRLAALALEGRGDPPEAGQFVATFSGGYRHVLEYLTGEVLAAQPESVQEFLLRTSFLPRLAGSLCDALLGIEESGIRNQGIRGSEIRNQASRTSVSDSLIPDSPIPNSQSLLEYLERANLFLIPLNRNDSQPWYRYHTLFAEAMRHYARQRLGETEVRALHEKASLWYEAHGLPDEAIEAATAAQQFERAAVLIEQLVETRGMNELYTVRRWAEQLPPDVLSAHPALCFNYAMALLFTSDRYVPATAALLETPLRMAEEAWRRAKNGPHLGRVLSLRAVVALWQGDLDRAFAYSRQSLELLDEHDVLWRGVNLNNVGLETLLAGQVNAAQRLILEARALSEAAQNIHARLVAAFMLGETYAWQGEFDQASQYYQQVLAEAVGGEEMLDDQGRALLGLGAIAFERNELTTAEQHASRALEISQQRSDEAQQVQAGLLLARVEQARGQTARAQDRLRSLVAQTRRPSSLREIQAWQAWLALAADDLPAAERWYTIIATQGDPVTLAQQEREAMIIARLRLAQGSSQVALELEDRRADAHAQGRTRSEVEILCLQALAFAAQSDLAQAARTLTRALMIAQPRGFRRVFLDQGPKMAALLQATIPQLTKRPLATYATALLRTLASSLTGSPQLPPSPLLEPLSPQEQRVLRLLAADLSNPEIARELVVSTNTVKTQVRSIFNKLDVSNRQEAAEAARELNLL